MANPNWVPGVSGNPMGRPVGTSRLAALEAALEAKGKELKTTAWEHVATQFFKDNQVMTAILKKIIPDLTEDVGMKELIRTYLIRATNDRNS